ncbi:MAG TPA: hypothetical protein VGI67_20125 [Thermoleophilaceae bacterium]
MTRKPLVLAAVFASAFLAPAAHAAIVPGTVIDGPSADIQRFGDLNVAPDGTGALVYVKKVGANDNIFASVFNGSTWGTPQRVSTDTTCAAATDCKDPHVAAGNGGHLVITFVGTGATLQAVLKPNSAGTFSTPVDAAPGSDAGVFGDDVDMDTVSGVAYAVIDFTAAGHVRASRLSGTTWTGVGGAATNLDGTTTDDVGNALLGAQNTARVAVDSSGNAVIAWPSIDAGMKKHVFARRITGTTPAAASIEISVPSLAGAPADGANSDSVSINGAGSSNPWISIREQFTYGANGRVRNIARQLVGDTPTAAQAIDGLPLDTPTEGAEAPRIAINPLGQGIAAGARQLSFQTFGSTLSAGVWAPGFRLDAGTPTTNGQPNVAIADSGNGLSAWMDSSAATTFVNSREEVGGVQGAPVTLSRSADGPILPALDAPIGMSSSAAGTVGVGFAQGAGNNEIVAAVVDLPQSGGGGGGGGGGNDTTPPSVSKLSLSNTTFALGNKLASISKTKKKKRVPVGTTISFTVSEQSKTTFTFARKAHGFRSGKKCVAHRPKGHKKAKGCTRFVKAKPSLVFTTGAGTHKVKFYGRLSKHKKLRPGRYRLTVTSVDTAGNKSKGKTASFRLLKS